MPDTNELYIMKPAERREAKRKARRERRAARRSFGAFARAHLSVFYLMVRRRGLAVAVLLGLMASEGVLFGLSLRGEVTKMGQLPAPVTFGELVEDSGILFPFAVAFLLLTALLAGLAPSGVHRSDLTVRRLAVGEAAYYLWQAVFAGLCYFLLAATQVVMIFGTGQWYIAALDVQAPLSVGDFGILHTFYASSLLHSLLPLADITRWIGSGALLIGMAVATAHADYGRWHRRGRLAAVFAMITYMILFPQKMGFPGQDILISLPVSILFCFFMIRRWVKGERAHE